MAREGARVGPIPDSIPYIACDRDGAAMANGATMVWCGAFPRTSGRLPGVGGLPSSARIGSLRTENWHYGPSTIMYASEMPMLQVKSPRFDALLSCAAVV